MEGHFENQAEYELPLKCFVWDWEGGLPCVYAFGWNFCTLFDNVGDMLLCSPCFVEGCN